MGLCDSATMWSRSIALLRLGLSLALRMCVLMFASLAQAGALVVSPVPQGPLGQHAQTLVETTAPLDLAGARAALEAGQFQPGDRPALAAGLGAAPVWQHLDLHNPLKEHRKLFLSAGMSWIDRLDVYVIDPQGNVTHWPAGDELRGAPHTLPGLGMVFELSLPPGNSALFVRAQTPDPMVVPLEIRDAKAQRKAERIQAYGYGILYGFLLALIGYNAVLFAGLRVRSHLYYSLYLLSFIAVNLAYTGHGLAWLWPNHPEFQRFVILVLMVLFGALGLVFANKFLDTRVEAPRAWRWMRGLIVFGVAGISLLVITRLHGPAVWFAFGYLGFVSILVVALGLWTWRRRQPAAGYFLAAALCGMGGTFATTFATWGLLPMNTLTFHAIDIGIMAEATLFALALAARMRHQESARLQAEQLARIDPLTGLLNRRAFHELAVRPFSIATRGHRPLCLLLADIDHFKPINDRHGHSAGDMVLTSVANMLRPCCRMGDLLVRWGGEEFLLMLPETKQEEARAMAERIRQIIAAQPVQTNAESIPVTFSVGLAELRPNETLDELIAAADAALYVAKADGRDCVRVRG